MSLCAASGEDTLESEAVCLFATRAVEALPSFQLNADSASTVVRLCSQLDGIPLAIELAAARVRVLSVKQIADRLNDRLGLLTTGIRTAVPRQQTLRATLDWSYGLLSESERRVFNRLAVFAGGWTLEAAEAVCAGDGIEPGEVLDLLARLVDQSMVQVEVAEDGHVRYRLLDTLRHYAGEKLRSAGDESMVCARHQGWAMALAQGTMEEVYRADQITYLHRLEREHDNLRAALAWSETGTDSVEAGLHIAAALVRFWHMRGYLAEARGWLRSLLALPNAARPTEGRALALTSLGFIEGMRGDVAVAVQVLEESHALFRELQDAQGMVLSSFILGFQIGWSHVDTERAVALLTESAAISRQHGPPWMTYLSLGCLGDLARERGEYDHAEALLGESWTLVQLAGDRFGSAYVRLGQGVLELRRGNLDVARDHFQVALGLCQELGTTLIITYALSALGCVAAAQGQPDRAARLFGAARAHHEPMDELMAAAMREELEQGVAAARAQTDEDAFAAAWAAGQRLSLNDAAEYARSTGDVVSPPVAGNGRGSARRREREVAHLGARGTSRLA
jgi:non-specific serine/threonine protein kinase